MNLGKNQRALMNFLEKHPNRWHLITRKKAIAAALRLYRQDKIDCLEFIYFGIHVISIRLDTPKMLQAQA